MKSVVHVTHEAVQKIGGIGAVLHGLLTSKAYSEDIDRDILVGPLFSTDGPGNARLGSDGEVLYSSIDGIVRHPFGGAFAEIERKYHVNIVYGRKAFFDSVTGIRAYPEVLLFNVNHYDQQRINLFKFRLFQEFGIESSKYEYIWDYEQYCRIAEPALEALHAIGCPDGPDPAVILSHEYMGMPTALAAMLNNPERFRTVFYAHEVAPMRRIVEAHAGHDITFYNALELAHRQKLDVNDVFGPQDHFYKYPLVDAARHCDNIFAVGDYIVREFRFLNQAFESRNIDLAYNGVPAFKISLADKLASRRRLQRYIGKLLGFEPDYVFTHVTRMVLSKGLWRDIRVMEQLETRLARENKRAVLLVLSTETSARRSDDVLNMEKDYRWPVAHREGYPDLTGGEAAFYAGVQEFNARSCAAKVIYINQFGFTRQTCGQRMPADMDFMDIRQGSDLEFGQSIYEPFGIAQVEPISFGGICLFTSLCGCAGFARHAAGNSPTPNVIEADYTVAPELKIARIEDCLAITRETRDTIETATAARLADEIHRRLPTTDRQIDEFLQRGYALAEKMSWDAVARHYVLPGIARALAKQPRRQQQPVLA
ncbi:MAG: hypothetical protein ACP5O7_00600 [Phycisphaerae bacterium]